MHLSIFIGVVDFFTNDHAAYFRSAGADLVKFRISQQPTQRIIIHISIPSKCLDPLQCHLCCCFRCVQDHSRAILFTLLLFFCFFSQYFFYHYFDIFMCNLYQLFKKVKIIIIIIIIIIKEDKDKDKEKERTERVWVPLSQARATA